MSRNTVAGGIPPDFGPSANFSPLAADSAAAFSRAAFSPSFFTSLAVSLPPSGGAGGGMTLGDGAGESTFESGALAASEVFGASATFTGSAAPFGGSVAGVAVAGVAVAAGGALCDSVAGAFAA